MRWFRWAAAMSGLVGALPSLLLAPPAIGQSNDAAVSVRAGPRWGAVTPGAWTPYVVTVANAGPSNVEGDVRLIPQREPAPSVAALRSARNRASQRAVAAELPAERFPIYQAHVTVTAGGRKTLDFLAVEPPFGYRADVRDPSGKMIAGALRPDPSRGAGVAMLTDVAGAEDMLTRLSAAAGERPVFTNVGVGDFPTDVRLLSGLRTVVIDDFDTARLGTGQRDALRDFVGMGGTLVLGGGRAGTRSLAGLPEELTPLRPSATATSSLVRLLDLAAQPLASGPEAVAPVVTGQLRHGRAVLETIDGVPLVVEGSFGAGHILQLAYDPLSERFTSDTVLFAAGWGPALPAALTARVPPSTGQRRNGATSAWREVWSSEGAKPRWPARGSAVLVAYLFAVVCTGAFVVRRRVVLAWVIVPLLAVGFATAVAVATRGMAAGAAATVVEVNTATASGTVITERYERVFGAADGASALEPGQAASTVLTSRFPVAPVDTPQNVISGVGGGTIVSLGGAEGQLALGPRPRGKHTMETLTAGHRPIRLEASVRFRPGRGAGDVPTGVTGRVTNRGTKTLRHLVAQVPNGMQSPLVEALAPGQSVDVDVRLAWPHRSSSAGSARWRLLSATADRALGHDGVLALVGEVEGGLGVGGRGLSVLVHTVQPDDAGIPGPLFPGARLVSAVAPAGGASSWLQVYDLAVPVGLKGPVSLGYDSGEVYDWTTGAWRRLPPGEGRNAPQPVPVTAGELGRGIVRVRAYGAPTINRGSSAADSTFAFFTEQQDQSGTRSHPRRGTTSR